MADGKTSLNLELLIKLLKLTTSSNDSEALLSARKANEVLAKFGGDWEALLRSKVTVIADPFTAAPIDAAAQARRAAPPPPPAPPQPPSPPRQPRTYPQAPIRPRYTAAPSPKAQPAPSRNTLRKQRVQLDDLA